MTRDTIVLIQAVDVSKEYKKGKSVIQALKKVNLDIRAGDFVLIYGPSGCGKSTLLNVLSGLDLPSSGRVMFDGIDTKVFDERQLPRFRREKLGFVFQDFNLIETMTAFENVMSALWPNSGVSGKDIDDKAIEVLRTVDLLGRKDHLPKHMSGGEQQRVAIARAMINNPKVIFADEPTGNLDEETGLGILRLLKEINEKHGTTIVLVSHDNRPKRYANRILFMKGGVLKKGPSREDESSQ